MIDEDDDGHDSQQSDNIQVVGNGTIDAKPPYNHPNSEDDPYAEMHSLSSVKNRQRSMIDLRKHPEEPRKVHLSTPDMGKLLL